MKKGILALLGYSVSCIAQITTLPATPSNIEKFNQIIDVRIPIERKETGVIQGVKSVDFTKNKTKLWKDINSQIDTSKPFAIICRSGRRSTYVAELIDNQDLNITILDGGMSSLIKQGYITTPYDN